VEEQIYEGNLSPELAAETALLIQRALQSSLFMDRMAKTERIIRELPYAAELDGVLYEGAMDLVFMENNRAVIVDFKTDRIDSDTIAARAEIYRRQADIYARSLQKVTGGIRPQVILFFLRPCEAHVFD
jgi:ATP-dependent helicase/nuclease subunit A